MSLALATLMIYEVAAAIFHSLFPYSMLSPAICFSEEQPAEAIARRRLRPTALNVADVNLDSSPDLLVGFTQDPDVTLVGVGFGDSHGHFQFELYPTECARGDIRGIAAIETSQSGLIAYLCFDAVGAPAIGAFRISGDTTPRPLFVARNRLDNDAPLPLRLANDALPIHSVMDVGVGDFDGDERREFVVVTNNLISLWAPHSSEESGISKEELQLVMLKRVPPPRDISAFSVMRGNHLERDRILVATTGQGSNALLTLVVSGGFLSASLPTPIDNQILAVEPIRGSPGVIAMLTAQPTPVADSGPSSVSPSTRIVLLRSDTEVYSPTVFAGALGIGHTPVGITSGHFYGNDRVELAVAQRPSDARIKWIEENTHANLDEPDVDTLWFGRLDASRQSVSDSVPCAIAWGRNHWPYIQPKKLVASDINLDGRTDIALIEDFSPRQPQLVLLMPRDCSAR